MRYYLLPAYLLVPGISVLAQSTSPMVLSGGGQSSQNGNTLLEYTIGEPLTTTHTAGPAMLTQGFHQPGISSVNLSEWEKAGVVLYPNPVTADCAILFSEDTYSVYGIYEASGRKVATGKLSGTELHLNITHLSSGNYIIQLEGKKQANLPFVKH